MNALDLSRSDEADLPGCPSFPGEGEPCTLTICGLDVASFKRFFVFGEPDDYAIPLWDAVRVPIGTPAFYWKPEGSAKTGTAPPRPLEVRGYF